MAMFGTPINLLFFMVWGFAGIGKLLDGTPPWFGAKFGQTILALSRSRGFVLAVGRGRSACLRARGCGPGARRILRPPGSHLGDDDAGLEFVRVPPTRFWPVADLGIQRNVPTFCLLWRHLGCVAVCCDPVAVLRCGFIELNRGSSLSSPPRSTGQRVA